MEISKVVYDEGILAGHVESKMVVDHHIITVPVYFKEHGFVQTTFWGHLAEEIIEETFAEKEQGKGLRFFFLGDVRTESFKKKNGEISNFKMMNVESFC